MKAASTGEAGGSWQALLSLKRLEALLRVSRAELSSLAKKAGSFYRPFDRRRVRGEGKWRHIDNPTGELKRVQKLVNRHVLRQVPLPAGMLGGVRGKSIRDNAKPHIGRSLVATIDIRDCFPSIDNRRVFDVLRRHLGCSPEIASLLTRLTTFQRRLPQGAPTSPLLANIVLLPLYHDVEGICESRHLAMTFWVDDITISGAEVRQAVPEIVTRIQARGFATANKKVRVMARGHRQVTTGLSLNAKVAVPEPKRRAIRDRIIALADQPEIRESELLSLWGRIRNVGSIDPEQGARLEGLADRLLPKSGTEGQKTATSEVRPCRSGSRHRRPSGAIVPQEIGATEKHRRH